LVKFISCSLDSIPQPFPTLVQPCLGNWDQSSLKVDKSCQNDTVYFVITNTGTGNMTCYHPVIIYQNNLLHLIDSFKLNGQQTASFAFPANGESWYLSVAQHPNHPGNSNPNATVENCGGLTIPTQINQFPQNDADPFVDIYCDETRASYDPNDKTGYPIGVTSDHFINANQQLQYRIRFQNTGTDTAFTVVIRDTLDTDLDIFSIRSGVSSHSYNFRMYGQRVLEWTFNDIMLPDSNVNEPLSHGFVLFTVDQLPDLPDGTQITNSAGIYFDFNAPIITNTAQHKIHYDIPITVDVEDVTSTPKFILYPNPNNGQFYIDLRKEYSQVELTVTDVTGRVIKTQEYEGVSGIPIKINSSVGGLYLVKVNVDGLNEVFKVVKY